MKKSVSSGLRRKLFAGAAGAGILAMSKPLRVLAVEDGNSAALGFARIPEGALVEQHLYALPGKVPLIRKTSRPANFETPIEYFRSAITPNDAFFVRYHLAGISEIKASDWTLKVGGDSVERELEFTLKQLKNDFEPAEITAVCQCAGNRRGLFEPHVAGVQWGVGAMGNALWRGVRLKDILARAGVKRDALEVVFGDADQAVIEKTPAFIKSLPIEVALDENTLVAFEMNGNPLPHWNGFPARIVVPGWTATYWVKHLTSVKAVSKPEAGFWMSTAYRLPRGKFKTPSFESQVANANEPITTMVVNSLITSLKNGQQIPRGRSIDLKGIAWDGGAGIDRVEVSIDSGASWRRAKLGRDLGRFSFREFTLAVPASERGSIVVMARATSHSGETQVDRLIHNPAGYHHNAIQRLYVEVV
ncbi:DMSO/TMAO reductase YedYZ molybdopterin-dependent catalytic subunit [Paraburkholderia sp. BL8N3]|jgi:DMSO/TMAO reductase YedYZ molybdopterin-dependent catalytic subunit|nr:molybdopterin-dependent oxidoreductase [Paraburkholderia sp. BL8N3]TCK35147.1 DMSO/TMAO reductase YedYZ molybdopterin-dependent catalytic subunit [Paraburkholderia sp. BL8N3]